MKKIVITGALGQIGSELTLRLRKELGTDNVIATDLKEEKGNQVIEDGRFEQLDVLDEEKLLHIAAENHADTLIHLAGLLSGSAEDTPQLAWNLNTSGLLHGLETARKLNLKFFTPSSIAAFGPSTPKAHTPQDTLQRPTSMYGVTKVAGELLCDYYYTQFGVDTRGVRFPGLISYTTPPGNGTTDYAIDIYYAAVHEGSYTSFIDKGTKMDMMYMPDAIDSIIQLLQADPEKLLHRNAFNISAMSFDPEEIKRSIQKYLPDFTMNYCINPIKQRIAESWPDLIDSSKAAQEWGFAPKYDLDAMTKDMLSHLSKMQRSYI